MYIIHDRFTPHIQEFMHALRIKNIVLTHWPTHFVDGVEVMNSLFLYENGVVDTVATRKILPLLNMSVEKLAKESWDGLKWYYVYFQRLDETYSITVEQIKSYIETYSPLVDGFSEWQTAQLSYEPIRPIAEGTSDAELVQYIESAESDTIFFSTELYDEISGDADPINRLLGIALLDSGNVLFEKEYRVTHRNIGYRSPSQTKRGIDFYRSVGEVSSTIISQANIEIRYRRKAVVDLVNPDILALLNIIKNRTESLDDTKSMINKLDYSAALPDRQKTNIASRENSINATLKNMYSDVVPLADSALNYFFNGRYYVKKAGLQALTAKDFVIFFGKSLKTGYKEEDADLWEKIVSIVLAVIVVIVAVFTGGVAIGGLGALVGASSSVVFAFATAFALALSVGIAILGGIAYLAGERGWHGFSVWIGKVINILGVVNTIAGIVAIYSAWQTALTKQLAAESLKQAGKEVTEEAVMELVSSEVSLLTSAGTVINNVTISEVGLKTLFETAKTMLWGSAKQSMMDILNKTVSAVNWASNYFIQKDLAALQGELTAQQEKADELKQEYEQYKGSVDKVYYSTSDMYDGYYNPYFNDFELSTGEGPDRIWATKAHWRCQNSIDWLYK